MSLINKKDKKPFLNDFSDAIEFFYEIGVEEILNFRTWDDGRPNARFTNYHIDFATIGGDPGTAYLLKVEKNEPIFEISHLCEDLVLNMFWYEFEIIRPFLFNSMSDIVNRYRSLLAIYAKYRSGEINRHSHPYYLEFLISRLRLYQCSIEDVAVIKMDKKNYCSDGNVEGLLKNDLAERFPFAEEVKSLTEKLIDNILLN